jgi:hypothetical protein
MCLVVDTCCLGVVFNPANTEHHQFQPVLDWITKKNGKIIYGGTQYKKELRTAKSYWSLLLELGKQGRVVELDDGEVDSIASQVRRKETATSFDDPHIVAIVIVSKCRVVCTNDKKAHPFLKKKKLYPKTFVRPRIYSARGHMALLSDANIVDICRQ